MAVLNINNMTPREKALDLINKFTRFTPADDEFELPYAKQCALIAVDEMMEVYASALLAMGATKESAESIESKYLKEVKREIELCQF